MMPIADLAADYAVFATFFVATLGGITPWMKVAQLAAANNLPVTSHGVHDIHVHLLAASPNASFLEVHGFGLEKYMREPLRFENGEALAPERPGHGVEFDFVGSQSGVDSAARR